MEKAKEIQQQLAGLNPEEIIDALEAENVGIEKALILKRFDSSELQERKEKLADCSVELLKLNQKLADLAGPIKEDIKGTKEMINEISKQLKEEGVFIEGRLFLIPDYFSGFMYTVNEFGEIEGSRKLRATERQLHINSEKHFKRS